MMSFCKQEGKDRIIFVTEDDHNTPSTVELPEDEEPAGGLIKEDGQLNFNCPCLGGMATGPCGVEFREAFTCFHYSDAEVKGSDCIESFKTMTKCMSEFPGVYGTGDDNIMRVKDDDDEEQEDESVNETHETTISTEDKSVSVITESKESKS